MSKDYIGPFGPESHEAGIRALRSPDRQAGDTFAVSAVLAAAVSAIDWEELTETARKAVEHALVEAEFIGLFPTPRQLAEMMVAGVFPETPDA